MLVRGLRCPLHGRRLRAERCVPGADLDPSLGEGGGDSAPSRVARDPRKGDINRMKLELRRLRLRLVDGFLLEAIFSLIRSQSLSLTAFQLVITVNQQSHPLLMVH